MNLATTTILTEVKFAWVAWYWGYELKCFAFLVTDSECFLSGCKLSIQNLYSTHLMLDSQTNPSLRAYPVPTLRLWPILYNNHSRENHAK